MPRLERCPLRLCLFCFGFFPTPSIQYVPLPHFGYNYFSLCPLGFESPTTFLYLDLIYSTNVWEKWEFGLFCLRCRLSWKLLLYMQILPYPHPLPSFLTKKGHTVRLPVGSRGAELACRAPGAIMWRGGDWNSCLISVLLIKWEFMGFKNSVSKRRSRWLYFGGVGTCGFKKDRFSVGCIFLLDFFVFFLESSTATFETMELKETQRPLSINCTVCEFV